jgi:hypothetical protein
MVLASYWLRRRFPRAGENDPLLGSVRHTKKASHLRDKPASQLKAISMESNMPALGTQSAEGHSQSNAHEERGGLGISDVRRLIDHRTMSTRSPAVHAKGWGDRSYDYWSHFLNTALGSHATFLDLAFQRPRQITDRMCTVPTADDRGIVACNLWCALV